MMRNLLKLPSKLDPRLQIRLAQTREEFIAAFQLAHEESIRSRHLSPDPSGLRLLPQHILPFTKTVIVLWDDQVVACASLTPDSKFGLPISDAIDLTDIKRSDRRVVEVYGLYLSSRLECEPQDILLPLFKYIYHLLEKYFRADYVVVAASPQDQEMLELILLFTPMVGDRSSGPKYRNGLPLVGLYMNVKTYRLSLAAQYKDAAPEKNPLNFLTYRFGNLKLPELATFKLTEPSMDASTLDYFFNQRTSLMAKLSPAQQDLVTSLFNLEQYATVLPQSRVRLRSEMIEREPRFDVNLQGRLINLDGKMYPVTVTNVSLSGFQAVLENELIFGELAHLSLAVGESELVDLKVIPVRRGQSNCYGFQIVQAQSEWRPFIDELKKVHLNQAYGNEAPVLRVSKTG